MEKKRVVVVGASGGIGSALVGLIGKTGESEVIALARREPENLPASVRLVFIDLEDESTVAAAADEVGGPVHEIYVASGMLHEDARGIQPEKALRQIDSETLATSFQINAIGPLLVAKYFAPLIDKERRAVFAALSARVGSIEDNRMGGWYAYRSAKAALNQLLKTAAIEFKRTHPELVVAGFHPGTVDTDLSKPFQRGVPAGKLFSPEFSAGKLLEVIAGLGTEDSGNVFAWDGARIPG